MASGNNNLRSVTLTALATVLPTAAFALAPHAAAQSEPTTPPNATTTPVPPAADPTTTAQPASNPWNFSLEFDAEHAFSSRVDGPGKASVTRIGGQFEASHLFGQATLVSATLASERSFYDFNGATQLSPGFNEPFEDTRRAKFGVNVLVRETEQFAWFVGGNVVTTMEDGAKFSDSLTFAGIIGARYAVSKNFSAIAGLAVQTRLEDNALPIPALGFDWKFAEKWRLSTDPGLGLQPSGDPGIGLKLSFQPTEGVTLALEGSYQSREFRLDDKGFAPEGVGIDRRAPVDIGVEWKVTSNITILARGGAYVWQHYKVEDKNGVKLSEGDSNPQGFVVIGAKISF